MNSKSQTDYYAVLGVTQAATEKDVIKAYRKLAKEKHPDKNPNDPKAKENFIKLKDAFDFLKDAGKRREYDNQRAQAKRDRERYAAFSAQYNQMAGPKGAYQARADESEWEALNRGEAYYTQWKKNQFAARQTAQDFNRKQKAQRYRDDLLNDWKGDQRAKYSRTMAKLKLMCDPSCKLNPRQIQNFLWAMNVAIPPNAPPGVLIAEFTNSKAALHAEKACKRFKPSPIRVQWITQRPQTEFAPPNSYYDADEQKRKNKPKFDANLEPEQDIGFGVGKKPSFMDSEVIIINDMGTSFGTTKNPIVIDDDEPKFGPQPRSSSPQADETITIEDDEDFVKMFRAQKEAKKKPETKYDRSQEQAPYQPKFPAGKTWEAQAPKEPPAPAKQTAMSSAQPSNEEIKKKFREQLKAKREQKEAASKPPQPCTTYTPSKSHEDIFREEMMNAQKNAFKSKRSAPQKRPASPENDEHTSSRNRPAPRKRPASPQDKRAQNEKLFDTLIYEPSSSKKPSAHKNKSSNGIDPKFEAELQRLKEKRLKEKEDHERAEKLAEEQKKARNARLFEEELRKSDDSPKTSKDRNNVRADFVEELERLKAHKRREREIKEKAARIAAMVQEISSESSSEDDDEEDSDESDDSVVDLTNSPAKACSREMLIEQLKRKKALAMARARAEEKRKQEHQRSHLENLAGYDGESSKRLDKSDTKLLFSQKW
ncbi:unnamed protein product [Oikopleura dioica]|uniref:J domain-containing protein n=1 Tax=Oikopleura dioica TaxID=34765 RepID=E4Y8V8_OIKDI|nr:unnamed protein product [Oikopleura dioica]